MKHGERILIPLMDGKEHALGEIRQYIEDGIDPKIAVRRWMRAYGRSEKNGDASLEDKVNKGKEMCLWEALRGAEKDCYITTSKMLDEVFNSGTLIQITDRGKDKIMEGCGIRNDVWKEIKRLFYAGKATISVRV